MYNRYLYIMAWSVFYVLTFCTPSLNGMYIGTYWHYLHVMVCIHVNACVFICISCFKLCKQKGKLHPPFVHKWVAIIVLPAPSPWHSLLARGVLALQRHWLGCHVTAACLRRQVMPSYFSFEFYLPQGFLNDFPKPWDKYNLARIPPSSEFWEVKNAFKLNVAWNQAKISYNLEWPKKKRFRVLETAKVSKNTYENQLGLCILASFAAFPIFMHLFWIDLKQSFRNLSLLEVFVGSIGPPFWHLGNTRGATGRIQISRFCWRGSRRSPVFKLSTLENECFLWFSLSIIPNTEKVN